MSNKYLLILIPMLPMLMLTGCDYGSKSTNTVTPAPETPAPVTPAPVTPVPVEPGPVVPVDPTGPNSDKITDAVRDHNAVRDEVFTGSDLVWNNDIAQSAQAYVDLLAASGQFEHDIGTAYGENLFASSYEAEYTDAIRGWSEEKVHYHYDTNSCDAGESCGHYTQIVWRDTTEFGCASAVYTTGEYNGWTVIACRYNPPGNFNNQQPY